LLRIVEKAGATRVGGCCVPNQILVAFVAKLSLHGFCRSEGWFPELLRILEEAGAFGERWRDEIGRVLHVTDRRSATVQERPQLPMTGPAGSGFSFWLAGPGSDGASVRGG
jgi:hypothetical protein